MNMNEMFIWWGGGILFLLLGFQNYRYNKVEEKKYVMSKKMIEVYRNKGFDDNKIITAVKTQGYILLLVALIFIIIGAIRFFLIY